jgi:hypothetical protein
MKHALLLAIAAVMVQTSPQLYAQGPHGIRTPQLLEANNKFTTFAPLPGYPLGSEARHLEGNGMFLLHVRNDGSVSRVDIVQSTGHQNSRSENTGHIQTFKRPNQPMKPTRECFRSGLSLSR